MTMLPVGYMAKRISERPEWLPSAEVADIYSVSGCISGNFAEFINFWKHNGYWFFDSPDIIRQLAQAHSIDLSGTKLFYYEAHPLEFDNKSKTWRGFEPEASFATNVAVPDMKVLEGFDVVSFELGTTPECSPLSCNGLASQTRTNRHCLLDSLERARDLLESSQPKKMEPGPYRIFAVYSVDWP